MLNLFVSHVTNVDAPWCTQCKTEMLFQLEYLLQEKSVPVNQPSRDGLPVLHSVATVLEFIPKNITLTFLSKTRSRRSDSIKCIDK